VHDCDEVYNFWEPLHFVLHGYGLQTWENSPQFALRSYLYLLLHALAALPGRILLGSGGGKRAAFHLLRALLGCACAAAEMALCTAAAQVGGRRLGLLLFALLLTSSGMFISSTTFLPSTFTMVTFAVGAALSLRGRWLSAVCTCVAGGLVGWPFAGLAALPLGLLALQRRGVLPVLCAAAVTAGAVLLSSAVLDSLFYGRPTLAAWNLVRYNVLGGESGRYGTEGALFYLLNIFNAFNLALPLALGAPAAELLAALVTRRRPRGLLLVVQSSLHVWLGAMSAIAHKEERFMYVIYPQICLGAAMSLDALCEMGASPALVRLSKKTKPVAAAVVALITAAMALLSLSRSAALIGNYGAPMQIYAQLPPSGAGMVCVGAEWFRFPSSFFLPGDSYRLGFVKTRCAAA
jgi:alpha-1,2-mannosyltransferase